MTYRLVTWYLCLLCRYLDYLTMVVRYGGYFGDPFKVHRGTTQGYPLSSTIFNVVVDSVLRHWVTMVSAAERTSELGKEGFV